MTRKEYMWVPVSLLPDSVISAYVLSALILNKHVLFEISKGMLDVSPMTNSSNT